MNREAEDACLKLAEKRPFLRRRADMIQAVRRFFILHEYLEVETPSLIPAPAPEPYIDAIRCGDRYLQTSPELHMKRLLAAGYPRLFQICRCFRAAERGERHLPEFTMLEWYRAGSTYLQLMEECERFLTFVLQALEFDTKLSFQGRKIDLQVPWDRITVADAFARLAPVSMEEALRDDRFDEMMACHIEPALGVHKPTFIHDYPLHTGSLAKSCDKNHLLLQRFELYIGGIELANACSELADPGEQRNRFQAAAHYRRSCNKDPYPEAEQFLTSLSRLPEAAGIALGIDRLAMIVSDCSAIDKVVAFIPEDK